MNPVGLPRSSFAGFLFDLLSLGKDVINLSVTRVRSKFILNTERMTEWLTQNDHGRWWLADQMEVHPHTIINWFEGKTVPDKRYLNDLETLTGISKEDLLVSK